MMLSSVPLTVYERIVTILVIPLTILVIALLLLSGRWLGEWIRKRDRADPE